MLFWPGNRYGVLPYDLMIFFVEGITMKKVALIILLVIILAIICLFLVGCGQKISHEGTLAKNDGFEIASIICERG